MDALMSSAFTDPVGRRDYTRKTGELAMTRSMEWVTLGTAVGCAVSGGVFFAFPSFAPPAIARLPKPQAIAAFQSINRLAVTPAFMTVLFGTALACVAVGIWAIAGDGPAGWLAPGCALFV